MEARETVRQEEWPDIDDHLVRPGSRAEIVRGRLVMTPPADEPHGGLHAQLAAVLSAFVRPGYHVAVDLLTRTSRESDFAPDVSVHAREPETGKRKLMALAFEVTSAQRLSVPTAKARELVVRGVRRVFCLSVKKARLLEWDAPGDDWRPLEDEAVIDDPCLVRPLPVGALLDPARADEAVVGALKARGTPALREIEESGRREGVAMGLRKGILDLCEALGIEADAGAHATLAEMDADELERLGDSIKRTRRWDR